MDAGQNRISDTQRLLNVLNDSHFYLTLKKKSCYFISVYVVISLILGSCLMTYRSSSEYSYDIGLEMIYIVFTGNIHLPTQSEIQYSVFLCFFVMFFSVSILIGMFYLNMMVDMPFPFSIKVFSTVWNFVIPSILPTVATIMSTSFDFYSVTTSVVILLAIFGLFLIVLYVSLSSLFNCVSAYRIDHIFYFRNPYIGSVCYIMVFISHQVMYFLPLSYRRTYLFISLVFFVYTILIVVFPPYHSKFMCELYTFYFTFSAGHAFIRGNSIAIYIGDLLTICMASIMLSQLLLLIRSRYDKKKEPYSIFPSSISGWYLQKDLSFEISFISNESLSRIIRLSDFHSDTTVHAAFKYLSKLHPKSLNQICMEATFKSIIQRRFLKPEMNSKKIFLGWYKEIESNEKQFWINTYESNLKPLAEICYNIGIRKFMISECRDFLKEKYGDDYPYVSNYYVNSAYNISDQKRESSLSVILLIIALLGIIVSILQIIILVDHFFCQESQKSLFVFRDVFGNITLIQSDIWNKRELNSSKIFKELFSAWDTYVSFINSLHNYPPYIITELNGISLYTHIENYISSLNCSKASNIFNDDLYDVSFFKMLEQYLYPLDGIELSAHITVLTPIENFSRFFFICLYLLLFFGIFYKVIIKSKSIHEFYTKLAFIPKQNVLTFSGINYSPTQSKDIRVPPPSIEWKALRLMLYRFISVIIFVSISFFFCLYPLNDSFGEHNLALSVARDFIKSDLSLMWLSLSYYSNFSQNIQNISCIEKSQDYINRLLTNISSSGFSSVFISDIIDLATKIQINIKDDEETYNLIIQNCFTRLRALEKTLTERIGFVIIRFFVDFASYFVLSAIFFSIEYVMVGVTVYVEKELLLIVEKYLSNTNTSLQEYKIDYDPNLLPIPFIKIDDSNRIIYLNNSVKSFNISIGDEITSSNVSDMFGIDMKLIISKISHEIKRGDIIVNSEKGKLIIKSFNVGEGVFNSISSYNFCFLPPDKLNESNSIQKTFLKLFSEVLPISISPDKKFPITNIISSSQFYLILVCFANLSFISESLDPTILTEMMNSIFKSFLEIVSENKLFLLLCIRDDCYYFVSNPSASFNGRWGFLSSIHDFVYSLQESIHHHEFLYNVFLSSKTLFTKVEKPILWIGNTPSPHIDLITQTTWDMRECSQKLRFSGIVYTTLHKANIRIPNTSFLCSILTNSGLVYDLYIVL